MGYETESIYKSLRGTLDELGYHQALSFDSLYLVKALVADLIKTTQSLKHYKDLSQKTLETCSELEVGIHPYKEDNARLLQECNQLNKKLIAQKDKHEDIQKDLKTKLRRCELDKNEIELRNGELSARLCDIEKDCLKKNERILELQNVILKRHPHRNSGIKPSCGKGDSALNFESKLKSSASLDSTVKLLKEADSKTRQLRSEVADLTQKLDEKGFVIESLQSKINSRDIEIERLSRLLENGRPLNAVIQEHGVAKPSQIQMFCTCKKDCKFAGLEHANLKLERRLKECLRRQHDAMLHALRLSEKNKLLESRLQSKEDKKECEKNRKDMVELQEQISSLTKLIEDLKKENRTNSQSHVRTMRSKTTTVSSKEKEHSELREKVEDYKIMERDLMKEMDRLERENLLQKSYIADLESKLLASIPTKEESERASKISESNDVSKKIGTQETHISSTTCHTDHKYETLIKERDHYQREYAFIVDKLVTIPLRSHSNSRESPLSNLSNLILERDEYSRQSENLHQQVLTDIKSDSVHCELKRRLSDQGREISDLKHKYRLLQDEHSRRQVAFTSDARNNADMSARKRGPSPTSTGVDLDTFLNLQDERDKLYLANCKLQEEKTELLSRIKKVQIESSSMNEDRIRSLESERRHLIAKQSDLSTQLGEMEEENRELKKKLYTCEHELCEERNSRNSIRRVQEQTDHALHSFRQSQESLEAQIRDLKESNLRLEAVRQGLDCQMHTLREDNTRLRACLQTLDTKNDSILRTLDSKIDLITRLERNVASKDDKVEQLEDRIAKLKSTLDETLNLNKRSEREAKLAATEVGRLQAELTRITSDLNRAQSEIRRLQADLCEARQQNVTSQQQLDTVRTEAEDLKQQLQHYCCEVTRIEDILSQKESERLELLNHLKFISQESAELENNNHSLDGEMKRSKNLLSEAEKKVMKLESIVQDKDCAVKSLEAKLQELSCLTAQLEGQLQCCQEDKYRQGEELATCQETLEKMLRQKEDLRQQLEERGAKVSQIQKELQKVQVQLTHSSYYTSELSQRLKRTMTELIEKTAGNQCQAREIVRLENDVQDLRIAL